MVASNCENKGAESERLVVVNKDGCDMPLMFKFRRCQPRVDGMDFRQGWVGCMVLNYRPFTACRALVAPDFQCILGSSYTKF